MIEQAPDRPDFDEYDAEMERVHRHNIRMQREYERLERIEDERRDEKEDY
ncbi:MAG: hypothetical protein ACI4ES_12310 [Roseburia sp.]